MLRYLSIQNLAVIESVEIDFQPGLNVLTGETGAGKSILVEALGLLMGDRASPELVRTGEARASVQAVFETADGKETIIRREVSAEGRSRAFVDGSLVTAAALKEATALLVELHGQHEHQILLDPESHLDLLDGHAGLSGQRAHVAAAFEKWRGIRDELDRLQIDEREKAARLNLLRFQLSELRSAALRPGEDDELASSKRVLASAERLQRLSAEAYGALYEGEQAALPQLAQVWRKVGELADVAPQFQAYAAARGDIKGQLEDLAFALRDFSGSLEASPARLQAVENRLAELERLKRKYGPTLQETIEAGDRFAKQIEAFEHAEERTASLKAELHLTAQEYLRRARVLSAARRQAALSFERELVRGLAELAMDRTRFEVRFDESLADAADRGWSERGVDQVECVISPNPGEELRPLARIASGGELSRIMLAMRALAAKVPGRAIVFDEVDAGIGGRVADVVGRRLRRLAQDMQVLCITHLPQVAAHATTHFRIDKEVRHGRTITSVTRLAGSERVRELARMLAGASVTEGTLASALDLLACANGEGKAKDESERRKRKAASSPG